MIYKTKVDCLYYKGYKPCKFHKETGVTCENCSHYNSIKKKIIVIKLGSLGDVLRTTSILPALASKYLNSAITWVTKKNADQLLRNNEYIQKLMFVEENYLEYILNEEFDVGICLDADDLSGTILNMSTCKEKFGFITNKRGQVIPVNDLANEWYYMGINDKLKGMNRKTYFEHIYKICDLPSHYHIPQYSITSKQKLFKKSFINKFNLEKYKKLIGINTGSGKRWKMKRWDANGYIRFIELIHKQHPEYGLLFYGGPEEVDLNKKIKEQVGSIIIDTGCKNTIEEFASLVSISDIFVTPDSLGMHLSISLMIPTIVIVGPTSPWELDVFDRGKVIYSNLDCIGCYLNECNKEINCMNSIQPEQIVNDIENQMKQGKE
ncbi:MAG: glycosyltransferase family 9 protein [Armatimonadetes bacterium]|nr:glycosyltransferase family 9 protein [Armatimonadota bacterium]